MPVVEMYEWTFWLYSGVVFCVGISTGMTVHKIQEIKREEDDDVF